MLIKAPELIKRFSEIFLSGLPNNKGDQLADYISGFLLAPGKKTLTVLGSVMIGNPRHKTVVSKFFRRNGFKSSEILYNSAKQMIQNILKSDKITGDWVLLIDGTSTKRGGFTKIANALQYREKNPSARGISTKAHTFVIGLLIVPVVGVRIPFRLSYYTKNYCKETGINYKKQSELAIELISMVRKIIPWRYKLIVAADSYFDAKCIYSKIDKENIVFITAIDKGRVCQISNGTEKIHNRGKAKKNYKKFILTKGKEIWTSVQSRYSQAGLKEDKRMIKFRITGEVLRLSGAGDVSVAYSWKKKGNKEYFKALLCTDINWPPEKIAEYYLLRWQIEIFFRELKSELGLTDFSGQSFEAFERFVDLCLLSFLFLEWMRMQVIQTTKSRKDQGGILRLRSHGLKIKLQEMVFAETRSIVLQKIVA
jgi:hypothetical protein